MKSESTNNTFSNAGRSSGASVVVQKGDFLSERFPQVAHVYTVGRLMIISGVRIRSGP